MTLSPGSLNSDPTAALRSQTNDLHREVEQSIDWRGTLGDVASYEKFLSTICYFLSPADRLIERSFAETESWVASRRTARWAQADWYHLVMRRTGSEYEASQTVAALNDPNAEELYRWVEHPSQTAGILYVLEGSTMGSVHLCQIVRKCLEPFGAAPVKFLAAYADETQNRWQTTKNWLDRFLTTQSDVAQAVDAAQRMFLIYGDQLSRRI